MECISCHQKKIRCARCDPTELCLRCQRVVKKSGTQKERKRSQKASSPKVMIPTRKEQSKIDQLSATLFHLICRIDSDPKISKDELDRYKSVVRTVQTGEYQQLVGDLINGNIRNDRDRKVVYTLTGGGHISGKIKLDVPSHQDIDKKWRSIRASTVNLVGFENTVSLPQPEVLGDFASKTEDFIRGNCNDEYFVVNFPSQNRCILKTLIGTLLCRWVFVGAMALFEEQYCGIIPKVYSLIRTTGLFLSVIGTSMSTNIK